MFHATETRCIRPSLSENLSYWSWWSNFVFLGKQNRLTFSQFLKTPIIPWRWREGNCNVDFFNFCHCQVLNFKISNQSTRDWNFAVNFWKHQKQKITKYNKIEYNQSNLTWNFIAFCNILLTFVKSHNFSFICVKSERYTLNLTKMTWKIC